MQMQTFLNKTKVNTKLSHIVVKYICILGIIFGKADAIMYNKWIFQELGFEE